MKKEEFYFDSRDGENRIHAVRWEPEDGVAKAGVLQIVHGMAEYIERYGDLAEYFTARGFVVTGEDHLGHGKSVAEGGTYGYFCEQDPATVVVRDVHRLKKLTQEKFPDLPYIMLGHSMGSFILRNYLCRYGSGLGGAIVMGTGNPPRAMLRASKSIVRAQSLALGPRHVANGLNRLGFGSYNKRVEQPRSEYDWLSRNEENVDRYLADPLCGFVFTENGFRTLFDLALRMQAPENLARMPKDLPILLVSGAEDPVGDYGAGVKQTAKLLKDAGVERLTVKLYPGDRHEILNEADRDKVKEDLGAWVSKVIKNRSGD